jgi:hypothetical protein
MSGVLKSVMADDMYVGVTGFRPLTCTVEIVGANWTLTVEKFDPATVTMQPGSPVDVFVEDSGRMILAGGAS